MTSTPVEVGTLIVVILKAKNLPNKRHIGKQDPYCSVKLNSETRRTKAVKRGGQHPEWDEEVRFTILEDVEDELARTAAGDDTDDSPPPPPPPKKEKKKLKGTKKMQLSCYADDPREPDLIGETMVDLTEVLTKGETDEWFTLTNKEKYCGEVYLELTFWSNEKPPEKRATPPSSAFHPQYGGPGSFTPSTTELPPSLMHGGSSHTTPSPSRVPSSSGPDSGLPPSLRPSGSLAQINLYTAPYEKQNRYGDVEQLSTDLADLGVSSPSRRRESFPPVQAGTSEFGYTGGNAHPNGSYSTVSSSASLSSVHSLGPRIPSSRPPQGHHRYSLSSLPEPFAQDEYPTGLPNTMPTMSESYLPQPPYQYQPSSSGFVQPPPQSETPVPVASHFSIPSSTPSAMPSAFVPPQPPSSAMSFHPPQPQQYPPPPQTPFQYQAYSQPPVSTPSLQYVPQEAPLPPPSVPPSSYQTPQQYGHHATPSPPHQNQQPPLPPSAYQQTQSSVPFQQGSRPLPTPQTQYQPRQDHTSPSGFTSPPPGPPPSMGPGSMFPNAMPFQPPGPPPPPPPRRGSLPPTPTKTSSMTYPTPPPPPPQLQNRVHPLQGSHLNTPPPPPPPPPSQFPSSNPTSSLPHGSQSPQPYPPQETHGYGTWASPPPPPPSRSVSGFSSPPHPSSFSTPPPPQGHQPYFPGGPSGTPEWNTPPRQSPQQHVAYGNQDGWRQ
ncbi:hypothetical protein JB92DRAFT_2808316 [Gautieria morchelliformis]|nr:hypothetical protein JB92DRAFT_2808316 [Gautieria morchelliformis]